MDNFFAPVRQLADYENIIKDISVCGKPCMVSGCIDSQKAHFVSGLVTPKSPISFRLVITYDEIRARQIVDNLRFYEQNVLYYPAKDFIFYSADMHGNELMGQRLCVLARIIGRLWKDKESFNGAGGDAGEDMAGSGEADYEQQLTVVTTVDGLADKLLPLAKVAGEVVALQEQDVIDIEQFKEDMVRLGYERMGMVEAKGQFCVRGGIIDIFPFTQDMPVRIELWDDEVDSIRSFDLESQRSVDRLDRITVFPAKECVISKAEIEAGTKRLLAEFEHQEKQLVTEKKPDAVKKLREARELFEVTSDYQKYINTFCEQKVSFLEYFPEEETLFVLDEPNRLKEKMDLTAYEFEESCKNRLQSGYILPSQCDIIYSLTDIYRILERRRTLALSALSYRPAQLAVKTYYQLEVRSISGYNNQFEVLVKDLKRYRKNGFKAVLVSSSKSRAVRLATDLKEFDLDSFYGEKGHREIEAGQILVTHGNLHAGFEYPLVKFVVITEGDIFGQKNTKKRKAKRYEGKAISGFHELSVGDFVVHENHGLGIYRGIEKITVDGIEKDYIKVEYAEGGNLYILATQLELLQKYAGQEAKVPKLNKLGSNVWDKTKEKVSRAVEEVAKDLVELYAKRQMQQGFQYGKDTVWQKEFEEMFPYEETADQLNAIEDTKRDMESTKIMDRLICGDVGFGKTEIAIRAAFKAVQESKQVAYLVPTTILAQQHYNTFVQRMKSFPVSVAMLSRFRTARENKETIDRLRKGTVDVVIGTHRLLSKDVEYKDLGLLIVDEEQRFGVTHKEKIKKLKENVDVLTLSATPIPRTLHMSLVGIRDMSVLEEAPVDRMPIQTFVSEQNEEIIREALRRELGRGGQVYYVYNRVNNIDEVTAHLQSLVPEANIVYAHGQMEERQLEGIMLDFINGEIDVLVSTTIIETGLDISNVNTIIIQDADKFGLSQLYQLRGRVGRSNRTAYAFLLYRRDRMLQETAQKRLEAIREFTDLGSGFKIAMKDLEIRGAGNVLGKSQHGHMAAVGYDLYCKMLNEAVSRLKGFDVTPDYETCVDLPVDAYISDTYIKAELQKLDIYKRIAVIENEEERMDMEDELIDRYGDMPDCAANLLSIALLKARAHSAGIMEIKGSKETVGTKNCYRTILRLYSGNNKIHVDKIPDFVQKYGNDMRFTVEKSPFFTVTRQRTSFKDQRDYIQSLLAVVEDLTETLI